MPVPKLTCVTSVISFMAIKEKNLVRKDTSVLICSKWREKL